MGQDCGTLEGDRVAINVKEVQPKVRQINLQKLFKLQTLNSYNQVLHNKME